MATFDTQKKIGILGGGQLGRMLIQSALDLDLQIHILDPDPDAPCRQLCKTFTCASLQDFNSVYEFGQQMDVVTIEIENVNTEALKKLANEGKTVYPQPEVLEIIQDKRLQKQFFHNHGIPTAPFLLTENRQDIYEHVTFLPAFHKLGKGGYDGKGVQKIEAADDIHKAFDAPGVLEKKVNYEKELSVLVARNPQGDIATFPVTEMVFDPVYNLVDYLFAPAQISEHTANQAIALATKTIEAFDMVGLLAVEMFLLPDGSILVNEVAPRPHNSGHHTLKANAVTQFDQHWRAILSLPLGATQPHSLAAMVNLVGQDGYTGIARYVGLEKLYNTPGIYVHLYGKKFTKPFRKMGHVTLLAPDIPTLKKNVQFVKDTLSVTA